MQHVNLFLQPLRALGTRFKSCGNVRDCGNCLRVWRKLSKLEKDWKKRWMMPLWISQATQIQLRSWTSCNDLIIWLRHRRNEHFHVAPIHHGTWNGWNEVSVTLNRSFQSSTTIIKMENFVIHTVWHRSI